MSEKTTISEKFAPTPTVGASEPQGPRAKGECLVKKEVAAMYRVTPRTVESWMRTGQLPYVRIGRTVRFRLVDLP